MKSKTVGRLTTLLFLSAMASHTAIAGDNGPVSHWVQFDVEGAVNGTNPLYINDLGTVVGGWYDASNNEHGFLRRPDGTLVNVDVPGTGTQTQLIAINDEGTSVGSYTDAAGNTHGLVRYASGRLSLFDEPDAAGYTYPTAINIEGAIIGIYFDAAGTGHGFLLDTKGRYTSIDPPATATTTPIYTYCGAVTDLGAIACKSADSTGTFHEIIRAPDGSYTIVTAPGAGVGNGDGTYGSWTHSLNDLGVLAGTYYDNNVGAHGYVRYPNGVIREFDVPGAGAATGNANGTYSSGSNIFGTLIGFTYDPNFIAGRGYVRYPNGTLIPFTAPGAPSTGTYTQPWCINLAGEITGSYYDPTGLGHGFVARVAQ